VKNELTYSRQRIEKGLEPLYVVNREGNSVVDKT
jgi:hypothetical protein